MPEKTPDSSFRLTLEVTENGRTRRYESRDDVRGDDDNAMEAAVVREIALALALLDDTVRPFQIVRAMTAGMDEYKDDMLVAVARLYDLWTGTVEFTPAFTVGVDLAALMDGAEDWRLEYAEEIVSTMGWQRTDKGKSWDKTMDQNES